MEKLLNLYNRWCSIPDKIRFLLVGGVNAAVSYIIFAIALYLIGNEDISHPEQDRQLTLQKELRI